jgi:hypothetical protein
MKELKQYLGDSVYADWDGYHVVLTTENGMEVSNTICLDVSVLREFHNYILWLRAKTDSVPPREGE